MIAVTGATGGVGGRVANRLANLGYSQRLIVRDPQRSPNLPGAEVVRASSYTDAEGMRRALDGVETLFLVSGREAPDRVSQHKTAVDAAVDAGVRRLVYLSFLGASPTATFTFARDHYATEQHIRASGLAYTFLRDSLYLDYIPYFTGGDGIIRGPAGDGRAAPVSRDDVADVAATLTAFLGRQITFVNETLAEARASRRPSGAPDWEIEGWVTSYAAIATGEMNVISDTVETVAGQQTLVGFLRAHPDSYAHLAKQGGM